jgi:hypothetical protein
VSGLYYADMCDVAAAAGCRVSVPSVCVGWERRARSSGGFPAPPLAVFWHHTASNTTPLNDLSYMINGNPDAPVGNWLVDRDGICYPIAAGASNCAGKGGPSSFSRGTIPADGGNTRGWQIECANSGTGGPWPVAQIDATFTLSNALNARVGNQPTDVISHAVGSGGGWTNRKIDPATAAAVQGGWRPRSVNSSGTWSLDDLRSECAARAASDFQPVEDDVTQADIDAIVAAVVAQLPAATWGYPLTNQVAHEPNAAGTLLEWTHAEAHGANS